MEKRHTHTLVKGVQRVSNFGRQFGNGYQKLNVCRPVDPAIQLVEIQLKEIIS